MKVLLLARYWRLPAPSRYRFYQYLPFLEQTGLQFTLAPLLDDNYVRLQYASRKFPLLPLPRIYARRVTDLLRAGAFDLIWLEKEALPWIPSWVEHALGLGRVPYVVDYDDACFHTYDQNRHAIVRGLLGRKIANLMRRAALVVAGNEYLADYARRAGAKWIEYLPSVVELRKYPCQEPKPVNDVFTIGWMGAPANSRHLARIADVLVEVCREGAARVRIVGGWQTALPAALPVEYRAWSEETEFSEMRQFDVGVMPLYDGPWERGKCGLKLINYMAAGLPTIASPVGVNSSIVEHGVTGFLADSNEEWITAFRALQRDHSLRRAMGDAGRAKVEREYCVEVVAHRLARWLWMAGGRTPTAVSASSLLSVGPHSERPH
jgi:glycosyltransferase involved in cell wall biosynthesis